MGWLVAAFGCVALGAVIAWCVPENPAPFLLLVPAVVCAMIYRENKKRGEPWVP